MAAVLLLVVSLCACSYKPMYCGIMTVAVVLELYVLVETRDSSCGLLSHTEVSAYTKCMCFGFTVMYCVHRNTVTGSTWWIGV